MANFNKSSLKTLEKKLTMTQENIRKGYISDKYGKFQ